MGKKTYKTIKNKSETKNFKVGSTLKAAIFSPTQHLHTHYFWYVEYIFSFWKREIFICDAEEIQRESVTQNQMRGHCKIIYFKSLEEAVDQFDETEDDSFFYILGFNPQKRYFLFTYCLRLRTIGALHFWYEERYCQCLSPYQKSNA